MQLSKINISFFFLVLIIPLLIFPQKKPFEELIKDDRIKQSIAFKSEVNFNKAYYFFINKKWDSTLGYSKKQLLSRSNKEISDYCHFFSGYSFAEKKLFKESKSEFILISNKFIFSPLVKKKLGDVLFELKDFENAIQNYKIAEKVYKEGEQGFEISAVYENLGLCYMYVNKLAKAKENLEKSLAIHKKEKDTMNIVKLYMDFASLYYQQNRHDQAVIYFIKAYRLSKKIDAYDAKWKASKNLSTIEEDRGNFKEALLYRKESERWKDSLNQQSKVWAFAEFEKKYTIAIKQKQIDLLKAENENKKNQKKDYLFLIATLSLLLLSGVFVYNKHVKGTNKIMYQKNKLDELNTSKDQLFSVVSHDLRSSVNALKKSNSMLLNSLKTKNYEELDQLLHCNSLIANSTYNLLDNLLHWALLQTKQMYFNTESVHVYSIVKQIEFDYMPLFLCKEIKFENSVCKNCYIKADINSLKIILRNLFDNAIKFSDNNSMIRVYTHESDSLFCKLIVEDNGAGMNQNTINKLLKNGELISEKRNSEVEGTGLGIQLCKEMIQKNAGNIAIESEPNKGTKIILSFPKTDQNGYYQCANNRG
jgi:K+-sensing histidine kinase KdpD